MKCNFNPFPNLSTERLKLRRITMNDDKEVFFQRSSKEMNEYVGNPLCQSIEEARAWIEKIDNIIANNEGVNWGVCLKDEDQIMGGFCYWNLSQEENKAEIGFGIYPHHQNKGYMSEVLERGLRYGFEDMDLSCIEAYTHPQNKASIRVLEKHGFKLKEEQPDDLYIVFELLKP
jgi:ribosomal-protein-alanine N-acetyltransferase